MGLPKFEHPTFELELPSTKQQIRYRPFLVKEEKMLLMAQSSGSTREILTAIKQVIENCIVTEGVDVNQFAPFDIEYFFIRLRAKSVNNIVELTYRDNEDDELYSFNVDLEEVKILYPTEPVSSVVELTDGFKLQLQYPGAGMFETLPDNPSDIDLLYTIVKNCAGVLFKDNESYALKEYSSEEVDELIQSFPVNAFRQIRQFAESAPKLRHELVYVNKMGNERKIILQNLEDFFTLR